MRKNHRSIFNNFLAFKVFSTEKDYEWFSHVCPGWLNILHNFIVEHNNIIDSETQNWTVNGIPCVKTLKTDSYYVTFNISLIHANNAKQNNILSHFATLMESMPLRCIRCGAPKENKNDISNNHRVVRGEFINSKLYIHNETVEPEITQHQTFDLPTSYQITVYQDDLDRCDTCLFFGNGYMNGSNDTPQVHESVSFIHELNMNFITNHSSFSEIDNEGGYWRYRDPKLKIRVIDEDHFFKSLDLKYFVFGVEGPWQLRSSFWVYYKADESEIKYNELNHAEQNQPFLKAKYAGQLTGYKDIFNNEIYTGDVVRIKYEEFEDRIVEFCAVVSARYIDYHTCKYDSFVAKKAWLKHPGFIQFFIINYSVRNRNFVQPLSELTEIEVIGSIWDKNGNLETYTPNIEQIAKQIAQNGFPNSNCSINEVYKMRKYLSYRRISCRE